MALFCCGNIMATTTVGATDKSTEYMGEKSQNYLLKPNQILYLEFMNYGGIEKNWNNWLLGITDTAETPTEYFILRSDNYAWGPGGNTYDGGWQSYISSNIDWDNFLTIMTDVKVQMTITRTQANVKVEVVMTPTDTQYQEMTETFSMDCGDGTQDIYAFLSVEKAYIVIDDDKTQTTDGTGEVEEFVYENDFSSTDGLTIIGSGSFEDNDRFGKVFQNVGGAQRTNYLLLPDDLLSHSEMTKALTIGFWVNSANAGASSDYMWAPIFTAYAAEPSANTNTWPMFALQYRGVMQVNCSGWSDYVDVQNAAGVNTLYHGDTDWLADKQWHYYTAVLEGENAKVYFDGELKNEWDAALVYQNENNENVYTTQQGLFSGGKALKYICLGGNQAWNWGDNDPGFAFANFYLANKALTPEEVAAQMAASQGNIESDGIRNFSAESEATEYFNLAGQRVSNTFRTGIYVAKGKKVIK